MILLILIVLVVACVLFYNGKKELPANVYERQDSLLSPAEKNFYDVLRQITGEQIAICPKPSLREVMKVKESVKENRLGYFNRISQKHVDFLLCDKASMQIICAVELDDRSHQQPDRQQRDTFIDEAFASAGIEIFHIPCRRIYGEEEIGELYLFLRNREKAQSRAKRKDVQREEPPRCPKCGAPMVLRTAQRGAHQGQRFYGCSNYPSCREVIPID